MMMMMMVLMMIMMMMMMFIMSMLRTGIAKGSEIWETSRPGDTTQLFGQTPRRDTGYFFCLMFYCDESRPFSANGEMC